MHREQSLEFTLRSEVQPAANIVRAATSTGARLLGLQGHVGEAVEGATPTYWWSTPTRSRTSPSSAGRNDTSSSSCRRGG